MHTNHVIKGGAAGLAAERQVIRVGMPAAAGFVPQGGAAPEVECVREQGVIRRINVRCGCGQLLTLICDYATEQQ
jgi:hypothetical protein